MSMAINDNEYPICESCGCQGGVMEISEDMVHYSSQFDMWICEFCEQQKWRQLHEKSAGNEEAPNTAGRTESPW